MAQYKVLFHLDEGNGARVKMALNNVKNLIVDLGAKNAEVNLIANSEGVLAFLKVPGRHAEDVARLARLGVRFAICENSLEHMGLQKEALLDDVSFVPSGVGELARKQAEGWAYIRP